MSAATCTLTQQGVVTTVAVGAKVTVRYVFNTAATKADLKVPYAVAVNGTVLPHYADKPKSLDSSRTIEIKVDAGCKVCLYLNSDAHPSWRTKPVYEVMTGSHDVLVKITERLGRLPHILPEVGEPFCDTATNGKVTERYEAQLTGDIWMAISHRYSADEADALLPSDTLPSVRRAVRKLFSGLPNSTLLIDFEAGDTAPPLSMAVVFLGSENVQQNISYCPLLTGEIPRTHPRAYAALITEAYFARVTKMKVVSGWRPSFGSIAHRAGLGLDINYVRTAEEIVQINRKALLNPNNSATTNVTPHEGALYHDFVAARTAERVAEQNLRKLPPGSSPEAKQAAERQYDESRKATAKAQELWEGEVRTNEPRLIHDLRNRLTGSSCVSQLLDPWYIDFNTGDHIPGRINRQFEDVEKGHNDHLHVTIKEPKIL